MYKKKQKIEIFINFILAVLAIGIFHMFIARKGALALYATEQQIPLALPFNSLIPIWISLYLILGISGAFIYIKRATQIRSFAMASWTIQLVLCILWPILLNWPGRGSNGILGLDFLLIPCFWEHPNPT